MRMRLTVICLGYPAFNAHSPYCHLWPVWSYHIFPHYLINCKIFEMGGGGSLNTKSMLWFPLQLLCETFLNLRRTERDTIINVCMYIIYIICHPSACRPEVVGRSRDRSPVLSLGIFSEASDKSMCPGSTQPLKMSTRIFLGVKAAGA